MKMFSADDSFELNEEDLLQVALDIENIYSEIKPRAFEPGLETVPPCSDVEKTSHRGCTSTPDINTSNQMSTETDKHLGHVEADILKLNTDIKDGVILKRDTLAYGDVLVDRHGTPTDVHRFVNVHANSTSAMLTHCACDNGKTLQNNLFSISDFFSERDRSVDKRQSPGSKHGIKKTTSVCDNMSSQCTVVSANFTTAQMLSGSPSVGMTHISAHTTRKNTRGTRCLQLLRGEHQKPVSDNTYTLIAHCLEAGQEMKHSCMTSSCRKTHDGQVAAVRCDSSGLPETHLKSHGLLEAVTSTTSALDKEGPAGPLLHSRRKRKFPGPAGKLPRLASSDTIDTVTVQMCQSPVIVTQAQADVGSQACEAPFHDALWLQMINELDIEAQSLLEQFNVTAVIRKASKKQLPRSKVPVMCVLIDMISIHHGVDASVLLRDQTGFIKGTVHHQLLRDYPGHFQTGTILVLRQVGVFSPSVRNHYLNITQNNIVCIYRKSTDGIIIIDKHNKFTADDFLLCNTTDKTSLMSSNEENDMQQHGAAPCNISNLRTTHKSPHIAHRLANNTSGQLSTSNSNVSQTNCKSQKTMSHLTNELQSPSCNRTGLHTPFYNRIGWQTPSYSRTESQTPSYSRTGSHTPSYSRTGSQTPSYSRTGSQTLFYNRITPQTHSLSAQRMVDDGKTSVFDVNELQPLRGYQARTDAIPPTSDGSSGFLTETPSSGELDDLLTGLDNEMLADF